MLRFLDAHWRFMEKVNGHAPFFGRKSLDNSDSFFPMWTAMLRFLYDFGIHHTSLTTGERQCSVFSSDFQRFRRYWTDMLRFLGQFQADFQLKSGWIEPLLVGGYAPFSPIGQKIALDVRFESSLHIIHLLSFHTDISVFFSFTVSNDKAIHSRYRLRRFGSLPIPCGGNLLHP